MMDWEQKDLIRKMDDGAAENALPRVLILGDSISLGYTPFVVEALKGKAFVTRPAENCGPSEFYLEERGKVRQWLGERPWDVIHVNFGIWDHHFINDKEEIFLYEQHEAEMEPLDYQGRLEHIRKLGYHGRTSVEAYGRNTREILANLKRHAAQVIFATSTPVPAYGVRYDAWNWIAEYNDVARTVCKELEVPVNDLYAVASPLAADQKDGCHFSEMGYRKLAAAVAEAISRYL